MRYFARRIGFFLATLWAAVTLNFVIPRLQPGDPAEVMVRKLAGKDAQLDPAAVRAMRAMLGARTATCSSSTSTTSRRSRTGSSASPTRTSPTPSPR